MFCLAITSCGLEEPYGGLKNNEGLIEFVARPVGFNNQTVETKAAANTFESAIYSCYLLVFDSNSGNLLQRSEASLNQNIKLNVKSGNIKACFLVNVTKTFAENIKGITRPEGSTDDPNFYLNSAVLDITYADHTVADNDTETSGIIGIPSVNFGGTIGTKKCLPMYGEWSGSVAGKSTIQVPIKRLFAKVTANLRVQLNLNGWENATQTLTHYELKNLKLYNVPTKVKLVEDSSNESAWRKTAGQYSSTPLQKSGINIKVYNKIEQSSLNQLYTYSFYVPEFYLNPTSNPTQSQEYKPQNYPQESPNIAYPIYMQLEGDFVKYSVNSSTITYKIFLGGDNIDDFSLARNTHYINELTIQNTNKNISGSADENTLDHRVTTTLINNPVAKANEAANCYVISKPGEYHFPAYKGAYKNLADAIPCEGGDYIQVIANVAQFESDQVDITNINIFDEAYDPITNMISFKVGAVSETFPGLRELVPNGNVVISLKDDNGTKGDGETGDDTTIWSWHLWFVSDFSGSEAEWATIGTQTYPNNDELMDRNLGAASATITLLNQNDAIGTYYRYGKKEPFIGGAYRGGGVIKDANGNAVTETWSGDLKSPTDPCPPGYRIPQSSAFNGNATKENAPALGAFRYWNKGTPVITTDDIYFPYSGYIDASYIQQSLGYGVRDTTKNYNVKIPKSQTDLWGTSNECVNYASGPLNFTNVTYSKYNINNVGYLSSQDKDLEYGFSEKGIDIISCTVQIGTWKRSGIKYNANYTSTETLTGEQLKSKNETAYNRLISVINGGSGSNTDLIGGWISDIFTNPKTTFELKDLKKTNGYQIRCIKE